MQTRIGLVTVCALALTLIGSTPMIAQPAGKGGNAPHARPQGPCDIYAAAGTPHRATM